MPEEGFELHEIVKIWLKRHEYDGLWNDDCWCLLYDLMSCGHPSPDCAAGHKREPTPEEKADGAQWAIGPKEA